MELDAATRATLKLALLPPGILLLLLLIGWLTARRFFGRLLLLVAILLFYAMTTPAVVARLAERLETVPALTVDEARSSGADAILVLLAGRRQFNPELAGADALSGLSLERIDHALFLHRRTGLPIVLSGGRLQDEGTSLAELGAQWLKDRAGVTPLAVEPDSANTWENARNSAALLRDRGIDRVLLVTHAFHMPRAILSARSAEIDAIPAPFAFQHIPADIRPPPIFDDWLPHPGYLGISYLLLHEMAGLVWYGFSHQ